MNRGQVRAVVACGVLGFASASCKKEEKQVAPDNVLELLLGGNHESLTESLRNTPGGAATTPPETDPASRAGKTEPELPAKKATPPDTPNRPSESGRTPKPDTEPPKPPEPRYRSVQLAEGDTLYSLCKRELGSGGRWKEIARLNGWSEAKAGRLRAGQRVKLPPK